MDGKRQHITSDGTTTPSKLVPRRQLACNLNKEAEGPGFEADEPISRVPSPDIQTNRKGVPECMLQEPPEEEPAAGVWAAGILCHMKLQSDRDRLYDRPARQNPEVIPMEKDSESESEGEEWLPSSERRKGRGRGMGGRRDSRQGGRRGRKRPQMRFLDSLPR